MVYKKTIARGLLLGLALTAAGCGERSYTTAEHVTRAAEYRTKGDLATALLELKNAAQKEPQNPDVRIALGDLQMHIGDGLAARKEYETAIRYGADKAKLVVHLARSAFLIGDYQSILDEILSEVVDARDPLASLADEQKAELLAVRALAHLQTGSPDRAQELVDQALGYDKANPVARHSLALLTAYHQDYVGLRDMLGQLTTDHPAYAAAWALLGDLEQFEGHLEAAEVAFTKAIDTGPRLSRFFRQSLLKRGVVRVFLNKMDQALADAERLKRIAPKDVGSQYLRGLVAVQVNDLETAFIELSESVASAPEHLPSKYYLGLTAYRRGNRQAAITHLEDYVSKSVAPSTADRLLAAIYLQEGDYDSAEQLLQRILRTNPNDEIALTLLSQVALPRGQNEAAIALLNQVLATTDQVAGAHINLGQTLLITGDMEAAISHFDEAIATDPEVPRAGELKIAALLHQGRFTEALAAVEELIARFPENPIPIVIRGTIFQAQGEIERARESFQQALRLAPGHLGASRSYAALLIEQREFAEARGVFEAALKTNQDDLQVLLGLAEIATRDGDFETARRWIERATVSNRDTLQPFLHLARYHVNTGQPAQALTVLDTVAQRFGADPMYLGQRGEAELAANQTETAIATFNQLVRTSPDSAHAHYLLARAYARLNATDRALESVDRAASMQPDHLSALIMRARLLADANRLAEAKAQLSALQVRFPDNPEVMGLEGWLYLAEGKPKEAVIAFERAAAIATTGALIQDLAAAQAQAGNWDTSFTTLESWLKDHPGDAGVRNNLAELYLFFNRNDEAATHFERILESAPDSPTVLNNLAWLKRGSDPKAALAYIDKALKIAPGQSAFLDTRGLILLDQGNIEGALASIREALEGDTSNRDYRTHLARALIARGDLGQAAEELRAVLQIKEPFNEMANAQTLLKDIESR